MTQWLEGLAPPGAALTDKPQERLAGTLVHRLFQFGDRQPTVNLLRSEERASVADVDAVLRQAETVWHAMRLRADVIALLGSGTCTYEIPFSMRVGDAGRRIVLRGTIDCLVRRPDGTLVVVEFKTGARRPEHEQQVRVYARAVRTLFPGATVETALLYPPAPSP